MDWLWITGPLMGAVIGYITNDIAVRMMFRPHEEKRIFGKRVPLTPGMIPKERARLASAIRGVLDDALLSPEVIERTLLSERVISQVDAAVAGAADGLLAEPRTLREILSGWTGEETVADYETRLRQDAGRFIMEKLLQSGIDRTLASVAVEEARKKTTESTAGIAGLIWNDKRQLSMEDSLTQQVRVMLATHAPAMLDGVLADIAAGGLDTPVKDLLAQHREQLDGVRAFLVAQYQRVIRAGLPAALSALDLGEVVESQINSLNMRELEALVMRVMRKELRAIVWLGALLGGVLGIANALVATVM